MRQETPESLGAPKRTYTLFLINPSFKHKHYGAQDELSRLMGKKKMSIPLALPLIAALTPSHYRIRIIDDETDAIPWNETPDLVGITTLVSTIDRAYAVADRFRSNGVPVVMGGPFATFMPDEALLHADAVVTGEAEGSWQILLKDFERKKMKRIYSRKSPLSFETGPVPRWDLVKTDELMTLGVQASRGCPYNCEFCLVNKMFGRRMRYRNPDDVVAEISALPLKKIFFVDDNLTIKKSYAKALIKKLKPLGISWVCQCSIDVADDDELLFDMADSGCLSILIGFESLRPESLEEAHKTHNRIEKYAEAVTKIHSYGINVLASFIVGFDADTPEDFERIITFAEESNLLHTMLSILAAAPGTDLYRRMEEDDRLVDCPRDFINGAFPCMRYKNFSQVEILDQYFSTLTKLLNFSSLKKRAVAVFETGAFAKSSTSEKVGWLNKASASIRIVQRFLFSSNKDKRALFNEVFRLFRKNKVSAETAVVFLLSVEAMCDYLKNTIPRLNEIRKIVSSAEQKKRLDRPLKIA